MKIAEIDTHLVKLPYTTGGTGNIGRMDWTTLDYVLIRIETEGGLVGWGAAFAYGGAALSVKAAVDHMLAPKLIGQDASAAETSGQVPVHFVGLAVLPGPCLQANGQELVIGDVDAQSPRWFRLGQRRIGLRVSGLWCRFGVGGSLRGGWCRRRIAILGCRGRVGEEPIDFAQI